METNTIKLSRATLSEQAYKVIKDQILKKEYPPGYRLREVDISTKLGISKTPLQLAFKALSQEGLVTINPGLGVFVRDFSTHEVVEIFELREVLEIMALEYAWDNLCHDELKAIRDELLIAKREVVNSNNTDAAVRLDLELHMYIANHCTNSMLNKILSDVLVLSHYFMINESDNYKDYEVACVHHVGIIEKILLDNKSGAIDSLKEHIQDVTRRLRVSFDNKP